MRLYAAIAAMTLVVGGCEGAPAGGAGSAPDSPVSSPVADGGGATPPGPTPTPDLDRDACGAPRFQSWIGRPRADIPAKPVDATWRIYRTGDALTEDYSAQRLNVEIDPATDRVTRVWCG